MSIVLEDLDQFDDIGMVHGRQDFLLVFQILQILLCHSLLREDFDRYLVICLAVPGQFYRCKRALTYSRLYLVNVFNILRIRLHHLQFTI